MKPSGETGSRTAIATGSGERPTPPEVAGRLDLLPAVLVVVLLIATLPLALQYGHWRNPLSVGAGVPFLLTIAALGAVAFLLPSRRFSTVALGLTIALAVVAQGLAAASGAAVLLLCAALIGRWMLPRADHASVAYRTLIRIALGFAAISFVTSLLAFLPINGPMLYGALALAVLFASLPTLRTWLDDGWERLRRLPKAPVGITPRIVALLLWLHLLITGFPDIGHDSLAMHIAIPNVVAQLGYWPFDVTQHVFAVMPMNGNWLYTVAYLLGGEGAPRIVNFAALLLATGVTFEVGRQVLSAEGARRAACLFLAVPLMFAMSATAFIDLILTFMCTAAVLAAIVALRTGAPRDALAAALLFGSAIATKLPALLLAPAFVLLVLAAALERRSRGDDWRGAIAPIAPRLPLAALAGVLLACPPYLTAWLKTGNPVFPFFNSMFQSPYYETNASFTNPLFVHPIDPTLWLDFTFRTTRFLESAHEGALGVAVFVLLPAGLLAALLRRQWTVLALGTAGLVFCLLVFREQVYLRYVLPVLPLLLVAGSYALDGVRSARVAGVVTLLLVAVGVSRLTVAWHPLGSFPVATFLSERSRDAYIEQAQPAQHVARALRDIAGKDRAVAFVEHNPLLALAPPRAFSDTWHSPRTASYRLSPAEFVQRLVALDIEWVIVPTTPLTEYGRAVQAASALAFSVGPIAARRMNVELVPLKELLVDPDFADPARHWGAPGREGERGAWVSLEAPAAQRIQAQPGDRIQLSFEYACPTPTVVRSQINWHAKDGRFVGTSIETAPCEGKALMERTVRVPDGVDSGIVIAAPHQPGQVRATRASAKLLGTPTPVAR